MLQRLTTTLALGFLLGCSDTDDGDLQLALEGAERITDAMKEGDWSESIKAMDLRALGMEGSDMAELKEELDGIKKEMEDSGVEFVKAEPSKPKELIELPSYRIALIPTKMEMKIEDGVVRGTGLLIAVKYPDEDSWKYLDASFMSRREIYETYDELPEGLEIPIAEVKLER